ncbi:hypothetical protein QFZ23_002303 [Arthrobacter globiformis]|nr:hypothetical protein [Arthrobacter globiformis]
MRGSRAGMFPGISAIWRELSGVPGPLLNIKKLDRDNGSWAQGSEVWQTVEGKVAKVATRSEKLKYRYSDFYCFMSLADFTAYVSRDDAGGESGFSISDSSKPAP